MSREHFPHHDNFEYNPEPFYSDDPGIKRIVEEMSNIEDVLDRDRSDETIGRVTQSLEQTLYEQGYRVTEAYTARVSGKIRPKLAYDNNGNVDIAYLNYIRQAGGFLRKDHHGYYRELKDEELAVMGCGVYATYEPSLQTEKDLNVGFECVFDTNATTVEGYVNSRELENFETSRMSTDGAREILDAYGFRVDEFCETLQRAATGSEGWSWIKEFRPVLHRISPSESSHLRKAFETYIDNTVRFVEEPYYLDLMGEIEMQPRPDEPSSELYLDDVETLTAKIDGIDVYEVEDEDRQYLQIFLRTRPLVEGMDEETIRIPLSSLMSLTPVLERENHVVELFRNKRYEQEAHERADDEQRQYLAKLHQEAQKLQREQQVLRALHQLFEEDQPVDMPRNERLEELVARSDALLDAYDIPSLVWHDSDRRKEAAQTFTDDKKDWLHFEEQKAQIKEQLELEISDAYNEQFALDESMLREVLFTMVQKRRTPSMSEQEHVDIRQELYSKMLVDYEQTATSKWLGLVDAIVPGESITRKHPSVVQRAQQQAETNRQQGIKEAQFRNEIGKQLLGGQPAEGDDPLYQAFRSVCDDLASYPFLSSDEKGRLVWQVHYYSQLPKETVEALAEIVAKTTSDGEA